jgi:hypothetical protein
MILDFLLKRRPQPEPLLVRPMGVRLYGDICIPIPSGANNSLEQRENIVEDTPNVACTQDEEKEDPMANLNNSLATIMALPGAIGVAIVDLESGMSLGHVGGGSLNLEIAAAGNTEVMRAKMRTMQDLDLQDEIDDILITLGKQYHIIRPLKVKGSAGLFMYAALDKSKANLAMSRHKLNEVAQTITI